MCCAAEIAVRGTVFPDPLRFNPERFLRHRPSSSEWFPCGGGHRRCIGAAFAMYEMKMILAAILKRTSLQLMSTEVTRPVCRGVILVPSKGGLSCLEIAGHDRCGLLAQASLMHAGAGRSHSMTPSEYTSLRSSTSSAPRHGSGDL